MEKTNRNSLKKIGTKIYGEAERNKRVPPDATTPIAIKQYILLL